jgi:hypothetical protein
MVEHTVAVCTYDSDVFESAYSLLQQRVQGVDMVALAHTTSLWSVSIRKIEAATFASELAGTLKHNCLLA